MPETAFLGAQIAPKSLSAGASPQTPLGELTVLPQTSKLDSRGPNSKAPTPKGRGGRGRERRGGPGKIVQPEKFLRTGPVLFMHKLKAA